MQTNDENWKDCWKKPVKVQYREITETAEIETREGKLYGYAGKDVLLKGIKGEVYPCKIDIFEGTHTTTEPLTEEQLRASERERCVKVLEAFKIQATKYYCHDANCKCISYNQGLSTEFQLDGAIRALSEPDKEERV
jgi:hypothetical protein